MESPLSIMEKIFRVLLIIMVGLLLLNGILSFFQNQTQEARLTSILVNLYLIALPVAIVIFALVMVVNKEWPLATSGLIYSVLWLVFKWIG